ncbi:hypothetical protein BLNAU_14561 [Blattamonas nauphoetae]|uniref:Uncharacterized protein n=1 Tax=Blattamonas nauphoetae TaxID=2049346 RepID=A0ABQ9XD63_9EUKA|nr:hypothetical protein BLNAU_14561 [Blattamonas nauphoetae]
MHIVTSSCLCLSLLPNNSSKNLEDTHEIITHHPPSLCKRRISHHPPSPVHQNG